jgi:hypothetical protein
VATESAVVAAEVALISRVGLEPKAAETYF